jgi:hypothetical protein
VPHHNKKADKLATIPQDPNREVSPQEDPAEIMERGNPDVQSTRAKSQQHGKVTAENWNQ